MKTVFRLAGMGLIIMVLAACGGLAGEPVIVATIPPRPTLNVTNPDDLGAAIFAARCASCHGESGRGDGAVSIDAGLEPPDFTLASTSANQSLTEWTNTIRFGRLDKMMPPWENSLSREEIDAVAAYTYTLWQEASNSITESASNTPVPIIEEATGTISGEIIQGTAGASVPDVISIALHVLDAEGNEADFEMQVIQTDPVYRFENILIRHDYRYFITAIYDEVIFYSEVLSGTPESPEMSLSVQIYEVTHDESVIDINLFLMRLFPDGNEVVVQQLLNFENISDRVYRGENQIDGFTYDSVRIPLPEDARLLNSVELVPRFLMLEDDNQNTLLDTQALLPGNDNLVEIVYALPFSLIDAERSIEFPVVYDVEAIEVMVEPGDYRLISDEFTTTGTQHFSVGVFESFVSGTIPANSPVQFNIVIPEDNDAELQEEIAQDPSSNRNTVTILGLTGIGLMLISGLALLASFRRESEDET